MIWALRTDLKKKKRKEYEWGETDEEEDSPPHRRCRRMKVKINQPSLFGKKNIIRPKYIEQIYIFPRDLFVKK